jgi:hypothetical protein
MNLKQLIEKMDAIEEAGLPASMDSTRSGASQGPAMPAQQSVHQTQTVSPQADRPGLAPHGDPKLYDIQKWLSAPPFNYPVKPDGLNGPVTKKYYDMATHTHEELQNYEHPDASSLGSQAGDWLGSAWGALKTFFSNFGKSFSQSSGAVSTPPTMKESLERLRRIDEGADVEVDECGPMPIAIGGPAGLQKQQDNVTMNVSMNGSGPGGIKDLMNILRNIEGSDHSAPQGHEEPIMGEPGESVTGNDSPLSITDEVYDDEEKFANAAPGGSPKHTHGIDAVTFSGDDMNSKAKVSPLARAPGTNTLREPVQEGLVERLSSLYNEIKTRDFTEKLGKNT